MRSSSFLARLLADAASIAFDPRCAAGEHDLDGLAGPACGACVARMAAEASAPRCPSCSAGGEGECGACLAAPRRLRVVAPCEHRGVARALVLALKAARREDAARPLAAATLLDARAVEAMRRADVIVPVPSRAVRRRERGFNPAEAVADELARQARRLTGRRLPVRDLLAATGDGKQSVRSAAERRRALRGTLRARLACRLLVRRRRVVLVDDVVTTGATVAEAARVLLRCGASEVTVVACTRAPGTLLDVPRVPRRP